MPGEATESPVPLCVVEGLRVGLLPGEPAGVICTRSAGAVELDATLQWPPGHPAEPVLHRMPRTGAVKYDLRETLADGETSVRGPLLSTDERALREALDAALRALSEAAAVREAALWTSASRVCRAASPQSGAVEAVACRMWSAGLRVRFGVSWSLAPAETDVAVGCRGAEEEMAFVLSGGGIDLVSSGSSGRGGVTLCEDGRESRALEERG